MQFEFVWTWTEMLFGMKYPHILYARLECSGLSWTELIQFIVKTVKCDVSKTYSLNVHN